MTYKTEFQANNTDIGAILNAIKGLPDASVVDGLVQGTLAEYSNDRVTLIGSHVFKGNSAITNVNCPAVIAIRTAAFSGCSNLASVNFPAVTGTIEAYTFYSCSKLANVNFPSATGISTMAFSGCSNLASVNFPSVTNIYANAFARCRTLVSLTLGASTVCTLSASTAFTSTPIAGYSVHAGQYGSIYVPASLLTSYKAATNWSYFSSRFVGLDPNGKISFTVSGRLQTNTFRVYPGTTWKEFIDEYNSYGELREIQIEYDSSGYVFVGLEGLTASDTDAPVRASDIIRSGMVYGIDGFEPEDPL